MRTTRREAADGLLWYSADPGRFPGQLGNYRVGRSGTYVRENFDAHGQTDEEGGREISSDPVLACDPIPMAHLQR